MPSIQAYSAFLLLCSLFSTCYGQANPLKRVLTLDLGSPASMTEPLPLNAPAPTGNNLVIREESNGDIGLYMGDGLTSDLATRMSASCSTINDACENAVQQGLLNAGYSLQSRQVGLILFAGGILLASFAHMIIELHKSDKAVRKYIPMPALQASSIKAATDATDVVIQTATNDHGDAVPVTQVPASAAPGPITGTATTIDPSKITVTAITVQSIAAGYEVDFLSNTELNWIQGQATKPCKSGSKRSLGGCAISDATAAMNALDGPLANLLTIGRLPRFAAGGDLYNAVQAIFDTGRAIAALAAIPDDTLFALAEIFLVLFDESVNHHVSIASKNTLPATDFAVATGATQPSSCSTGAAIPACPDSDCSGDPVHAATCTVSGKKSGCKCAPVVTPYVYTGDSSWLNQQQTILSSMMKRGSLPLSPSAAKPTCTSDGAPWYQPPDWCRCGPTAKYPTIAGASGSAACAYKSLPAQQISPVSIPGAAPTNIPGLNGLPGCAMVLPGHGQACRDEYCNCGGIAVKPVQAVISGTTTSNCDIKIQPTANDCPTPTTAAAAPKLSCNAGNGYQLFDRTKAIAQITKICIAYHDNKLVLGETGPSLKSSQYDDMEQIQGAAANGATLVMNPVYSANACDDPENPNDADFGAWTVDQCVGYFTKPIDGCPNFSNPKGDQYWKSGGTSQAACVSWTVRAVDG